MLLRLLRLDERIQLYRGQIPSPGQPTVAWRKDRVRFWAAIAGGMMTEDAAVVAGVSFPVAFRWFRHAGGVNPCLAPTVSGRYLSFSEREDMAIFRAQGHGVREIARRLGRSPSTISRELRRNASTRTWRLEYKASLAQWHAERRARRPRAAKLVANGESNSYAHLAGTSMAAPHVSGGLALLLAQGRTPLGAVQRMIGTADSNVSCGHGSLRCMGRLDVGAAVQS